MLHEFLSSNREELISRCRAKVAKRHTPKPTERELEFGIPVFLAQLTAILREESVAGRAFDGPPGSNSRIHREPSEITRAAVNHGSELLHGGFPVDQVVHDYGDLCQAITDLAIEIEAPITNEEFRTLNRCLDDAIADAVLGFAGLREMQLTEMLEDTMNERLGHLAHEIRNLVNTAVLAVAAIKHGSIGIAGATGAVLDRSLRGLQDLCARALVDVRLREGIPSVHERLRLGELIEEIRVATAIDAEGRGVELSVLDVEPNIWIEADRQILGGAIANLLQNAMKFTQHHGKVLLRTLLSEKKVLIEIEDECGGLPPGDPEELFRNFQQKGSDRTGLGLGLGISRRGVEASGGELHVRDLPGRGCVFTIAMPQAGTAAAQKKALPRPPRGESQ